MKTKTIKIKAFEIKGVDIEFYMKEYNIETREEAVKEIRQTAIDAIYSQLGAIGALSKDTNY
jgi:ribosomal protein L20A (L18A)